MMWFAAIINGLVAFVGLTAVAAFFAGLAIEVLFGSWLPNFGYREPLLPILLVLPITGWMSWSIYRDSKKHFDEIRSNK